MGTVSSYYIRAHQKRQLGRCAGELCIVIKLVNAYLQKLLVFYNNMYLFIFFLLIAYYFLN